MTSWQGLCDAVPELAEVVRTRFDAHKHKTMATLRVDGSPRISGIEVPIFGGQVWIAGMTGSVKLADLRRDPRVALHSASEDPDVWTGDAKLAGRAIEVTADDERARFADGIGGGPPDFELFSLDIGEAVTVALAPSHDHLVIESWTPERGYRRVERR
jgi:hypothetical protein